MKSTLLIWRAVAVLVVLVATTAMVSAQEARTGDRPVPETFTATTTNMEPAGESLKFTVLRWSSEQDRREVLSILIPEEAGAIPSTMRLAGMTTWRTWSVASRWLS